MDDSSGSVADNLAETIPQDVWNATTFGYRDPRITDTDHLLCITTPCSIPELSRQATFRPCVEKHASTQRKGRYARPPYQHTPLLHAAITIISIYDGGQRRVASSPKFLRLRCTWISYIGMGHYDVDQHSIVSKFRQEKSNFNSMRHVFLKRVWVHACGLARFGFGWFFGFLRTCGSSGVKPIVTRE